MKESGCETSCRSRKAPLKYRIGPLFVCLLSVAPIPAFAQATAAASAAQTPAWTMPRTEQGTPDFQGATWNFGTMTPLTRAPEIDKVILGEAEAAAYERQTAARQTATTNNGYDWWDGGAAHLDHRRSSLIIDPADGRLPALTPEAQRRPPVVSRADNAEGPEDYALNARCIWWQNAGPPMIPSPYNNNLQFIQTRDYVVISTENIHDARVIPMDGRPHGAARQWAGDSRGRWEQNTLVVDTVNFSTKTSLRGSDENLHIVERFTMVDAETLEYRFTVEDPTVWTRPWTAGFPLNRTDEPMYEFACHEGNDSLEGMLKIARLFDKP